MYFGGISKSTWGDGNALYSWEPSRSMDVNASLVLEAAGAAKVHWVDTFAFDDEREALLFTSNRLDVFFNNRTEYWSPAYNPPASPNVHVMRMRVGASSYIAGQPSGTAAPTHRTPGAPNRTAAPANSTPADTSGPTVAPTNASPTAAPQSEKGSPALLVASISCFVLAVLGLLLLSFHVRAMHKRKARGSSTRAPLL